MRRRYGKCQNRAVERMSGVSSYSTLVLIFQVPAKAENPLVHLKLCLCFRIAFFILKYDCNVLKDCTLLISACNFGVYLSFECKYV